MDDRVQALAERFSRDAVVELVRDAMGRARTSVGAGGEVPNAAALASEVLEASLAWDTWPTPVINATGVVLHTNLGRAPLSEDAIASAQAVAGSYTDLEYDLAAGRRGSRQAAIAGLVCQVTGAEAALVVNNNASAMLLGLMEFASGKEVIVSRGEAVEIGGGFRIPDVLRHSGAELVEVGTTNRTYVRDFEAAITERTGAILAVHSSNFRTVGFTHAPSIPELVELGRRRGVPVLHDLGSGCLLDTADYGLAHEPMPQESLAAGVDLAFFSGDKLLGGPQAGLIAGTTEAVGRLARHPVARAVRTDKMSLAALASTLLHYLRGEAPEKVPVWTMIAASPEDIAKRAGAWSQEIGEASEVVEARSTIGGGSLPGETLPSFALAIDSKEIGASALVARLRAAPTPVIARIEDERVLLDPRTVLPTQDAELLAGLASVIRSK
jgi:L-seryl-tRNA(Ser) seleniumtransferase